MGSVALRLTPSGKPLEYAWMELSRHPPITWLANPRVSQRFPFPKGSS
jgi:hypothetical protein